MTVHTARRLRASLLVCLASAWVLGATGCGGGGGGNSGPADATASADVTPNVVTSSLDVSPSFAGSTEAVNLVAEGYFPMAQGDNWAYDDTYDGSTTVAGLTRSVLSGPDEAGQVSLQELEDTSTSSEDYVVSAAGISVQDPLDAHDDFPGVYDALGSWLLFQNAPWRAGEVRKADASGDSRSDVDGDGKSDRFRLHVEQTFKGFKTLTVLGQPTPVAHITTSFVLMFSLSSNGKLAKVTFTTSDAYAKGLGLVQTDRMAVDGNGGVVDRQQLVLRAASVSGVGHGVSAGNLSQSAVVKVIPRILSYGTGGSVDPEVSQAMLTLTTDSAPYAVTTTQTGNAIATANTTTVDATHTRITVQFKGAYTLGAGTFNDTLTIKACVDRACKLQAQGSPYTVPVTAIAGYTQAPEPGATPLIPLKQQVLSHDVMAAKYSRTLDRVVMVSSTPSNALYVMNPATGSEQSLSLTRVPTSLALSPDGGEAAVGQDGRVTWVKLNTVGLAQPEQKLLDVSTKAFDVLLDSTGHVQVSPMVSGVNDALRVIDVASNTEVVETGNFAAQSHLVTRHDEAVMYSLSNAGSPTAISRWSMSNGQASYNSVDFIGWTYDLCDRLWMSADDRRVFTACGTVLRSTADASVILPYSATLPLTLQPSWGTSAFRMRSLSQYAASNELAVIEYAWRDCLPSLVDSFGGCFHHLNLYTDDNYQLQSKLSLGPVALAGSAYDQEGVEVFHSADGQHLYLITHLMRAPSESSAYLFNVVR